MIWTIGPYSFGGAKDEPNPGPKQDVWRKSNIVEVKPIPGKGKKFITIRTSDSAPNGPLWECTLTIRSITNTRYMQLKTLVDDGGPFIVICHHGMYKMYIIHGEMTHDENDKEPPLQEVKGGFQHVGTWVLDLVEAND